FYLCQAIGKRFILFDGVKGRSLGSENLPSGPGFANLDDLRDHIDGHVEVQLEKKNMQPISQVFPCEIITCNDYHIHQSLKERIVGPIEMKAFPFPCCPQNNGGNDLHWTRSLQVAAGRGTHFGIPLQEQEKVGE
ncbi:hypothetical protein AVEN_177397-1, partial [Araneus ventricosus]